MWGRSSILVTMDSEGECGFDEGGAIAVDFARVLMELSDGGDGS